MSAYNFSRIDLDMLYPPFRDRLFEVVARLNARGFRYVATAGYRGIAEQMMLWQQGRTRPGAIVTSAKGGESQHNYGIAVDFVLDKDAATPAVEPGWAEADFQPLVDELKLAGLHSGAAYKDRPHAGIEGFVNGKQLVPLFMAYKSLLSPIMLGDNVKASAREAVLARLKVCWQHLDSHTQPLPAY